VGVHKLYLILFSLLVSCFVLVEASARSEKEQSSTWLFCETAADGRHPRLSFWAYIYYLSKYYEASLLPPAPQQPPATPTPQCSL